MTEPLVPAAASATGESEALPTWLEAATRVMLADLALGWRVEAAGADFIALLSAQRRVILLEYSRERPASWLVQLDRLRRAFSGRLHVALLGGPRELRLELLRYVADLKPSRLYLQHVDGSGEVWQQRRPAWRARAVARSLERGLHASSGRGTWRASEAMAHARRVAADLTACRIEAGQYQRFLSSINQRTPWASLSLVLVLLGVFALQWAWGGVDLPPLLAHMGSLVPARARAGEWWRFFACTFLHGGTLHLVINGFVLWMLGRFLERFLGSTRFLLIYFASGLAGSLSSSLFVASQSVGASGAIWGLLGAEAALAFYPRPLLPPAWVRIARLTALTNLGLNLLNSFSPHVDLAAHVGGGLMGGLVFLLLAASGQVPEYARLDAPVRLPIRLLGAVSAALFALGFVVATMTGRPWQLSEAPVLARVPLGALGWTVELPTDLSASPDAPSASSRELGNLAYDRCAVDITWAPLPDAAPGVDAAHELSHVRNQLALAQAGLDLLDGPRVLSDAGHSWVSVRYRYVSNPDVLDDRAVGIVAGVLVRVDVVGWDALPLSSIGLAARVLRSLEPEL
jgi:membrane associated rhomboid family serine protease